MSSQVYCEFVVSRSDGRKQYPPPQSDKLDEDGMLITYNRVKFNDAECFKWRRELGDRAGIAYAHDLRTSEPSYRIPYTFMSI